MPADRQSAHWCPGSSSALHHDFIRPDTLVQDKQITRSIYRCFEGKLALDCFVIEGGEIAVGDEVHLLGIEFEGSMLGAAKSRAALHRIVWQCDRPRQLRS
jgi:hypothetical protein